MSVKSGFGLAVAAGLLLASAGPVCAEAPDAAAAALHAGNASNAVALATQALADPSLSPRDRARVLIDRSLAHESLGERDGALIDCTEAINLHALAPPEQARAFYDRGVTLDELGRTDDAIGDYSAAVQIEPKFAAALNNRGNAHRRLNRLPLARADYLASLAAGNSHVEYPNFGLGEIAEASGQTDEARGYYRAALAANPQFMLASERLNALGNAPLSAAELLVVLRPPAQGEVHLRPPSQGAIHLRPPGQMAVHLRPPRAERSALPASPLPGVLKPAINEGGQAGQTVQLGAWRSQSDATNAWSRIAAVSGDLLAGLSPQVIPVDLQHKGRFYRLQAGPVRSGTASGLCTALRAKGIACMVVPN